MFDVINIGLVRGMDGFLELSPSLGQLAKAKWLKQVWRIRAIVKQAIPVIRGNREPAEAIGRYIGRRINHRLFTPVRNTITKTHMRVQYNKRDTTKINGIGGRTWINPEIDADKNGRIIKNMVIIYHDANKAGCLVKEG